MRMFMLFSLLCPLHLWAVQPILTNETGSPWSLKFHDGREAAVIVTHVDSPVLSTHFKIVDNTCVARQNMTCQFEFQIRRWFIALAWTKHPDHARVGQTVKTKFGMESTDPLELTDAVSVNLPVGPTAVLDPRFYPQTLNCDDFSWLPTATKDAPASVSILRWDGEDSDTNSETRVAETRSVGGAFNVTMQRKDPRRLAVTHAQATTGTRREFPILMLEPNISLTTLNPAGETCQIGVSSALSIEALKAYENLKDHRPSMIDVPAALVGVEPMLKSRDFKRSANGWATREEETFE